MPRKARVEFPGAVYHLLDRGDRQEAIFRDDADREQFLATLAQTCERTGWRVHAFVLMTKLSFEDECRSQVQLGNEGGTKPVTSSRKSESP